MEDDNKERDFEHAIVEAVAEGCGLTLAIFAAFAIIGLIISLI